MCAIKSASKLALLALLKDSAKLAAGAPSCHRVASQWTMVFTEECTSWFSKGHSEEQDIPTACEQNFTGGVAVDTFPRNNKVVVMDNKQATNTFDLQPSQKVAQYGAGVVIVQTTRDMTEDQEWHARNGSVMAKMVRPRVDYLAARDEKYVEVEVRVKYAPRHKKVRKDLRHRDDVSTYSYDYSDAYLGDDEENRFDFWLSKGMPDKIDVGRYKHWHDYSYDFSFYHSYDFSFEFDEGAPREPHYVRTATSLDVYVCSDEHEEEEEEQNFYCDPIHGGIEQCYGEANPADVRSLSNRHMKMYCEPQCLSGGSGGLWCDIFGLDGCRMCSEDCSAYCEGKDDCRCIQCANHGPKREHPRPSTTPQPTTAVTPSPNGVDIPLMSAAPTPGSWPGVAVKCTPGDADSCYSQLSTFESANLDRRSRGLTCEESCITGGGLWCDALGLEGCRFCAYSCEEYCATNGMPENCKCIEC